MLRPQCKWHPLELCSTVAPECMDLHSSIILSSLRAKGLFFTLPAPLPCFLSALPVTDGQLKHTLQFETTPFLTLSIYI